MSKKIITFLILILFFFPVLVFGSASFLFLSKQLNYKEGQIFSVPVYVIPDNGEKIFTAKASVVFDPQFLEITSFSFKEGVLPLVQEGYDKIDNNNGVLVKTAGYSGGISSQNLLGTITFRSKKYGTTNVLIGNESLILNSSNSNVLDSANLDKVTVILEEEKKQSSVSKTITPVKIQTTSTVVMPKKMNSMLLAALSVFVVVPPIVLIIVALVSLVSVLILLRKKQ